MGWIEPFRTDAYVEARPSPTLFFFATIFALLHPLPEIACQILSDLLGFLGCTFLNQKTQLIDMGAHGSRSKEWKFPSRAFSQHGKTPNFYKID